MATFWDHLAELRTLLLRCVFAVVIGALVAHIYHETLIALLLQPVRGTELIFLSPLDPLLFILKVDLAAGGILALPVISWIVFSFLKPAVERRHWLRFGLLFSLAGVLLLVGLIYAYLITVPLSLAFLTSISIAGIGNMITANSYLSFLLLQLLLMAVVFQTPLLVLSGIAIGAFDVGTLASKRRLIYLTGLIVLAVLTPTTDLFSLGIVALPALAMFEGSLLVGQIASRKLRRAANCATDNPMT
ncbi:MAG: twin-arginine translocase subunit TatC [Planctomycetaceae bacterium]|nr:twin-arginine translocase subunit TatC [Planctomycetaceae bacterium]